MKFQIAINGTVVNKEVGDWERLNTTFTIEELDANGLKAQIRAGHAFTSPHAGRRCADNWISAQHLALDFDDGGSFEAALEHDFIYKFASFLYTTPSHTPEAPRCRAVFILDQPITDRALYAELSAALVYAFAGAADEACKDVARLYFGSAGCAIRNIGRVLPLAAMDDLLDRWRDHSETTAQQVAERKAARAAYAGASPIEAYNAKFDVVEVAQRYGYEFNRSGTRARRPGGTSYSVVVWPDENKTFHHSSSDQLFSGRGGLANQPADPFDFFRIYEHSGDQHRAVAAAAELLGMEYAGVDDAQMAKVVAGLKAKSAQLLAPAGPVEAQRVDRTRYTVAELLRAEFPEPAWTVQKLLPTGLVMLSGRPKQGKSFLSLQLANCVAHGVPFLGFATTPARVFYLALEDSGRRLQARLRIMNYGPTDNVIIETAWPDIYAGGLQMLFDEIVRLGAQLAIVDTFSRVAGSSDQLKLGAMGPLFNELQSFATRADVTLLVIDHQRKSNGIEANPIDDVMGSTGKSAPLDAVFGLYRKHGETDATLASTGRDIEEGNLKIRFDPAALRWERTTDDFGVKQGSLKSEILFALRTDFDGEATLTDIAKAVERDKSNVRVELAEMVLVGALARIDKPGREKFYRVVDSSSSSPRSM